MMNVALMCVCVCTRMFLDENGGGWGQGIWSYLLEGLAGLKCMAVTVPKVETKKRTVFLLPTMRSCFCPYGKVYPTNLL